MNRRRQMLDAPLERLVVRFAHDDVDVTMTIALDHTIVLARRHDGYIAARSQTKYQTVPPTRSFRQRASRPNMR